MSYDKGNKLLHILLFLSVVMTACTGGSGVADDGERSRVTPSVTKSGVMNRSASRAEMIPMTANTPKLMHMAHTEVAKQANTAEVTIDVVTIATPTTLKVRRIATE